MIQQLEAQGLQDRSSSEEEVDDKDSDDKFDKMLKVMTSGFSALAAGHGGAAAAGKIGSPRAGSAAANRDGKFRSPGGHVRKKSSRGPGSASSTSTSATTGSRRGTLGGLSGGSGGPLVTSLFSTSEEEEEEEEEAGVIGGAGAVDPKISMMKELKTSLEVAYDGNDVLWENRAPERAFNDAAPLAGLQLLCGDNVNPDGSIGPAINFRMSYKDVDAWLIKFDESDIVSAKANVLQMIGFWKGWKMPAKRMDMILRTHQVQIDGPTRRKIQLVAASMILGRKLAGKTLPGVDDV
jgi:hypothetical protein